jgi:hypothetical protein
VRLEVKKLGVPMAVLVTSVIIPEFLRNRRAAKDGVRWGFGRFSRLVLAAPGIGLPTFGPRRLNIAQVENKKHGPALGYLAGPWLDPTRANASRKT